MRSKNAPKILKSPVLPEEFQGITANLCLFKLLKQASFDTVLDIGSGSGDHAAIFESAGKKVTRFDFGKSRAFDTDSQTEKTIIGDYLNHQFGRLYDCVWASHVLEHTVFTHEFIVKITKDCRPSGWIAITVPPAKPEFVGGHVTLWTPALLLYRMVLAGIDCREAKTYRYGYNISVIVKNQPNGVVLDDLAWDLNDIDRLKEYFPEDVNLRMNGEFVGKTYNDSKVYFR